MNETPVTQSEIDAVLDGCRVLVAIAVRSLAAVSEQVDLVQLRILVMIASRGSGSLSEVADATDINLSKASRTCDRMVTKQLISRADNPRDRRNLRLTLTPLGRRVVQRVASARRAAIVPILAAMEPERRAELAAVLSDFSSADGEPVDKDLWAMGWGT